MDGKVCLGLRLHVPFWCSFRDPSSSNVHRTFPVPPPTTLYGLIAAALGLPQEDYSRRGDMRFAIAIEKAGETVETYSKWMKAAEGPKGDEEKRARQAMRDRHLLTPDESVWISTPLIRQKIIQPVFMAGVLCSSDIAREVEAALTRPVFPLCLGESDDPVDVETLGVEAPIPTADPATGAVSGVRAGGMLASLPARFHPASRGKWTLERWLVTVPKPGAPVDAAGAELVSCHGQRWCFEPTEGRTGEEAQRSLFE
jgi:CRISPR-associated Cas5-like protein